MKKALLIVFLLSATIINAQTTVKGIVTEQNSGNKPIPGVQIKVLGSIPEVSDNSGTFQLVFTNKKPGDRIIVSEISKKGYEIVNLKEVIESWMIPADQNQHKKIVMCPEGMIAENSAKYYGISLSALTKGYEQTIKDLMKQRDSSLINMTTYSEKAKALGELYKTQQKQLEELAEKFARENFDDCSAVHRRAFDAFQAGNIEEAISILESVNSEEEINKAKQQKQRGIALENTGIELQGEALTALGQIEKMKVQAELYVVKKQFVEAENQYKLILKSDSTNILSIVSLASFYDSQSQFTDALNWYQKAVVQAKTDPQNNKLILVDLYLHTSEIHLFLKQFDLAEFAAREGLKLSNENRLKTILAFALMFQEKEKKARRLFTSIKDQDCSPETEGSCRDFILHIMEKLEDIGIIHPEYEYLRKM